MFSKRSQLKRSLLTAASAHRGYCAFRRRIAQSSKTPKVTERVVKSPRNPTPNSQTRVRLPVHRHDPIFLDGRSLHRVHDDSCMALHLKRAIQISAYIERNTFGDYGWETLCTVQKRMGRSSRRWTVAQQRPDLGLTNAAGLFREGIDSAEKELRDLYKARGTIKAEVERAKTLLTNSIKHACEAADAFYSQPPGSPLDATVATLHADDLDLSWRLAFVRFAESELRSARAEMQSAGDRLLANEAAPNTAERTELIEAVEYADMRLQACQWAYQDYISKVITGLKPRLPPQPAPVYPLTALNMGRRDVEEADMRVMMVLERQAYRDEDGRPDERGGVYLPSAPPFIQETSGMYDLRKRFAAAEANLLDVQQQYAQEKAIHFVLYPTAAVDSFDDGNVGQTMRDRQQEAIQDVDDARRLYQNARQVVQDDVAARSAPSELSLASQVSDYVDNMSADITQRIWGPRSVPPTPVRIWQSEIAADFVLGDETLAPSPPASVTSRSSVDFLEGISNGNGSDHSESGRTKRRRQRWMERRRPLGFDMDRYGFS